MQGICDLRIWLQTLFQKTGEREPTNISTPVKIFRLSVRLDDRVDEGAPYLFATKSTSLKLLILITFLKSEKTLFLLPGPPLSCCITLDKYLASLCFSSASEN